MVVRRLATDEFIRRPLRPSGGNDRDAQILGAVLTFYSHSIFKGSMRTPYKVWGRFVARSVMQIGFVLFRHPRSRERVRL